MLDLSAANLRRLAITWVGNKNRYEGISIPKQTLVPVHDVAQELVISSFLKPFEKTAEFFYFHHEEDVSNHQVYQSCMNIFQDPESLSEEAGKLAQMLYEHCENPKVQGGEFLVAYFDDLLLSGEPASAIGLWKIQTKDPYLKVERTADSFTLNVLEGIATGKLETAALIFNLDEADGYRLFAVDTVTKKGERSFWKDAFLRLQPIEDNYFNTRHYINLSGEFIHERLPHKFGLDRADQLDALYRSGLYFKENEHFELEDFAQTLFPEEDQQVAFREFRDEYTRANAVPLDEKFDISPPAVRKEFKVLKSVLKLDKNFHIYVHGRRDLIERGFDEDKGKKYYKVYFDEED
ncbi:MAG: nucleoid-associated protein [Bacteroidetes bacterium]|nr:MAG: nucleoid-associated protein [Bacteroidota bacterium]